MTTVLNNDPERIYTAIRLKKSVLFRLRELGYVGLSAEQVLVNILDTLDRFPAIKEIVRQKGVEQLF